jgi:Sugar (and other) transporter
MLLIYSLTIYFNRLWQSLRASKCVFKSQANGSLSQTKTNLKYLQIAQAQEKTKFSFQLMSSFASSIILRRGSRKVLFVVCSSAIILSCLSLATFSFLKTNLNNSYLDNLSWLPLVFVTTCIGSYAIGVYPVLQVLAGEVFPSDIRSLAIGVTLCLARCLETTNVLVYPLLVESFNFYGAFFIYACSVLATTLWGFFNIPDNRGLSLAKVEEKFSSATLNKVGKNYES